MRVRRVYTLTCEKPGDYAALLRASLHSCSQFMLIVRDEKDRRAATETLDILREHLISEEETSEWPGTRLLGRKAHAFRYRLTASSAQLLQDVCSSFSSWIAPDRPEDLSLLRADSSVWLGSIAHEKDIFLELEDAELRNLALGAPDLVQRLRMDAAT